MSSVAELGAPPRKLRMAVATSPAHWSQWHMCVRPSPTRTLRAVPVFNICHFPDKFKLCSGLHERHDSRRARGGWTVAVELHTMPGKMFGEGSEVTSSGRGCGRSRRGPLCDSAFDTCSEKEKLHKCYACGIVSEVVSDAIKTRGSATTSPGALTRTRSRLPSQRSRMPSGMDSTTSAS